MPSDLLIARNPDDESSLPFLLRIPLGAAGVLLKARDTWKFSHQKARTTRRPLPAGDNAVELDGQVVVAAVERKTIEDLSTSLTTGRLRYALAQEWTYWCLAAALRELALDQAASGPFDDLGEGQDRGQD